VDSVNNRRADIYEQAKTWLDAHTNMVMSPIKLCEYLPNSHPLVEPVSYISFMKDLDKSKLWLVFLRNKKKKKNNENIIQSSNDSESSCLSHFLGKDITSMINDRYAHVKLGFCEIHIYFYDRYIDDIEILTQHMITQLNIDISLLTG
jgi:hypothetical protein